MATGTSTSRFDYDGAGNRLRVVRDGVTTRYLHDVGGNVVAELDGSGAITRYYIHGLGLLGMVQAAGPNAGLYVYHADGTGHVIALTDASGEVANAYSYGSFGERLDGDDFITIDHPFTYAGLVGVMEEPGHGLYYMRARYYHVASHRFVNEDPSGFNGGLNLYAYVGGNPLRYVDPNGLTPEEAAQWAQSQVGSRRYSQVATSSIVGGWLGRRAGGIGAFKCNVFVFDALAKGNVGVPLIDGRAPTTAEWVAGEVSGYRPVTASEGLKAGNVVVSNGHMGIYAPAESDAGITISASGVWPGAPVVKNDFGFRPEDSQRKVFRAK